MLNVSEEWKRAYPDAHVGILIMHDVENPPSSPALEDEKRQLEEDLRTLFHGRSSLKDLKPVKSIALIGTPIQIILTIGLGFGIGYLMGWEWKDSLWIGACFSLSELP